MSRPTIRDKSQCPDIGKPWTEAERRLLRVGVRAGWSDVRLGSALDRTAEAVQMVRLTLGLRRARRKPKGNGISNGGA